MNTIHIKKAINAWASHYLYIFLLPPKVSLTIFFWSLDVRLIVGWNLVCHELMCRLTCNKKRVCWRKKRVWLIKALNPFLQPPLNLIFPLVIIIILLPSFLNGTQIIHKASPSDTLTSKFLVSPPRRLPPFGLFYYDPLLCCFRSTSGSVALGDPLQCFFLTMPCRWRSVCSSHPQSSAFSSLISYCLAWDHNSSLDIWAGQNIPTNFSNICVYYL